MSILYFLLFQSYLSNKFDGTTNTVPLTNEMEHSNEAIDEINTKLYGFQSLYRYPQMRKCLRIFLFLINFDNFLRTLLIIISYFYANK